MSVGKNAKSSASMRLSPQVGTAFVADAFSTSEVVSDACSKQIVNWDVAKERLHETTSAVATGWERLKGGVKSLE